MNYETIKASTPMEAIQKSERPLGTLCPVVKVDATANSDGSYTLLHKYGLPVESPKPIPVPFQPLVVFAERIRRMNETFEIGSATELTDLGSKRMYDFYRVLSEEVEELIPQDVNTQERITQYADTLGDIVVYCFSEARRWGIPLDKVLHIIMDSQDSKLVDGKPLFNAERTKFIKGPNYVAPEGAIRNLLFQDQVRAPVTRPATAETIV